MALPYCPDVAHMGGHSEDNESNLSPDTLIHKKGAKVAVGIMKKKKILVQILTQHGPAISVAGA